MLLFFRRSFTTAVLKAAGKTPVWREQVTIVRSWSSKNLHKFFKSDVGIGSQRQVVGFTWEETQPRVFASTRTKLSSISSGTNRDSCAFCWTKRLDLVTSVLLLKWHAKSSHSATDAVLEDSSLFLLMRRPMVEKRILVYFLLTVMDVWNNVNVK